MSKLTEKLTKVFEQSKLKTIGDLIDNELSGLAGADKFPARIREYSLDPRSMFMLPDNFLWDSKQNGVPVETIEAVATRTSQIRTDMMRQVFGRPAMDIG